jgi:uncharacterized membrane protein required for colicin V production
MRLNWVDWLSLGLVSTVGAVQYLRGVSDFSRVLYEALALVAAVVGASCLHKAVNELSGLPQAMSYALLFLVLGTVGIVVAGLVNRVMAFSMGVFDRILSVLTGVLCGWMVGHVVLRFLLSIQSRDIHIAIRESWMASQLLYFGAFWELLAMLRIARYHNI